MSINFHSSDFEAPVSLSAIARANQPRTGQNGRSERAGPPHARSVPEVAHAPNDYPRPAFPPPRLTESETPVRTHASGPEPPDERAAPTATPSPSYTAAAPSPGRPPADPRPAACPTSWDSLLRPARPKGMRGMAHRLFGGVVAREGRRDRERRALLAAARRPVRGHYRISEASSAIGGLLLATNVSGGGIDRFVEWAQAGRHAAETVRAELIAAGPPHVAREYGKTWRIHPDGIGSVEFTLHGLTKAYRSPQVRASSACSDFTAADLIERNGTLFIVDPPTDADTFAPMLTALIASVIHAAEKTYEHTGRALDPRLGLFLDEAGNVFRYPGLGGLLSTGREMGIVPVTIWHDLAQLENLYGPAEARTILSQSKMRLLLPGCADITTLDYWSRMLGQAVITRGGQSYATDGRHTSSTSQHQEALAPLHVLQQINRGEAIMQYDNLPPMRIHLRSALTDKCLLALKQGGSVPNEAVS